MNFHFQSFKWIIIGENFNVNNENLNNLVEDVFGGTHLNSIHESLDNRVETRRQLFNNLMNNYGFIVCNDRHINYTKGDFTYVDYNGSSVIDLI